MAVANRQVLSNTRDLRLACRSGTDAIGTISNCLAIGIAHIMKPAYGNAVEVRLGEPPIFWACGVTTQATAAAKPEFTYACAGRRLVTARRITNMAAFSTRYKIILGRGWRWIAGRF
jgi:uncharacterized protein YcsI (UPF0317 family)